MRLTKLRTANVGGLRDTNIALEEHRLLAFAGANGTGKSKLLACLLAPWTRALPTASDPDKVVEVEVGLHFDSAELDALEQFDREVGWNGGRPAPEVSLTLLVRPLAGLAFITEPHSMAVQECFANMQFLRRNPSCNLIYLPAERRLLPPNNAALDLSQLAEEVGLQRVAEARNSSQNYGRLDDQEFETYAPKHFAWLGHFPARTWSPRVQVRVKKLAGMSSKTRPTTF